MSKPDLASLSTKYERVKKAAAYFLEKEGKTSQENTLSTGDLFARALEDYPTEFRDIGKPVFAALLSKAATEESSLITTLGRRKGYYLARSPVRIQTEEEPEELRRKEKRLYGVVQEWLMEQGYRAADVSDRKGGGVWGNPDVCGIELMEHPIGNAIEIVTIEVKPSIDKWEKQFFEAVSHRRFANRSYYAFAHPVDTVGKIPQDMRYYCELFGVGVLVIVMDADPFQRLQTDEHGPDIERDNVDIVELYSAPYHNVQPKYQYGFLDVLDLEQIGSIVSFGEKLET